MKFFLCTGPGFGVVVKAPDRDRAVEFSKELMLENDRADLIQQLKNVSTSPEPVAGVLVTWSCPE